MAGDGDVGAGSEGLLRSTAQGGGLEILPSILPTTAPVVAGLRFEHFHLIMRFESIRNIFESMCNMCIE